jgi:hypothetical protein
VGYTGQVSSRNAESQNTHSSWVARAKAACMRSRRDDEAPRPLVRGSDHGADGGMEFSPA